MVKTKDGDGIKSNLIINEVQKRPCLFDSNHPNNGDRTEKARCWDEVYTVVVPGYATLGPTEKFAAGKEVQKRWRSIRDSYTKAYRQGKCVPADQCTPGSRRYQYHAQMSFLLRALKNKKPRYSQDKYESFSEISNSPQHPPPEDMPKIKHEVLERPLDLKTRPETDKTDQAIQTEKTALELKIDANSILPDDHFDDDKLFMNSLLPLFKKMDDDTRLLCRIEVLKIIRYALKGHKCFEALRMAEDTFFRDRMSGILAKQEVLEEPKSTLSMTTRSADGSRPVRKRRTEHCIFRDMMSGILAKQEVSEEPKSTLSMTTRSADGIRSVRKRRNRSPSPQPMPVKKRGPGRPRKVRPPPSDSDEEQLSKKRGPKMKVVPLEVTRMSEMDETLSKATSVAQLSTPLFMKMYNLERSKTPTALPTPQNMQVSIKSEPVDDMHTY